jgi:guanine nucleotide-binding protein G(i) subunit alpha
VRSWNAHVPLHPITCACVLILGLSVLRLVPPAFSYFNKIGDISAPGYIPSVEDVLRSRVRTSGIVEELYNISGVDFAIYDVGGQRNERKKWIHCFDGVTAVIFVASLSEYDQVLYEDHSVNRMVRSC